MNIKTKVIKSLTVGLVATSLLVSAALAQTNMTEETIARLEGLGYSEFQVTRTFFGRVKIVALSKDAAREVVMNQHTGEIMREVDMTARIEEMRAMMAEQNQSGSQNGTMGGSGMGGSGTGGSGMGGSGGSSGGMGG